MSDFVAKLAKLPAGPRSAGAKGYFTEVEWDAVSVARARGVPWNAIQEAEPRYKSVKTLQVAWLYRNRKKGRAST
jgi:hypothetical protein